MTYEVKLSKTHTFVNLVFFLVALEILLILYSSMLLAKNYDNSLLEKAREFSRAKT